MTAVEIVNLSKRFGSVTAVNDLSLSIPTGCIYALLGPNGAGKTTTIRLVVGLLRADAGRVRVGQRDAGFGRRGYQHLIGYLPEEVRFPDWMRACEYLEFAGSLFGLPRGERTHRATELLRFVGLDARDKAIRTFSKGMRQRLGIAQALVNRPQVLILDEPASGLDPLGRAEILHTIRALQRDLTVVMSTHILEDAERVCDRVGILDRGVLVADASMEDLRRAHAARWIDVVVDERTGDLCDGLASLLPVERVVRDGHSYRIRVTELRTGQREILGFLLARDASLVRFDIAAPRLEDVFVSIVRHGGVNAPAPSEGD